MHEWRQNAPKCSYTIVDSVAYIRTYYVAILHASTLLESSLQQDIYTHLHACNTCVPTLYIYYIPSLYSHSAIAMLIYIRIFTSSYVYNYLHAYFSLISRLFTKIKCTATEEKMPNNNNNNT